jgi:uncharacterized protein
MNTYLGVKRISFLMPENGSIKDKRQIIRKLRDTIKSRFNVCFSEIDVNDKSQRATIAISSVSTDEAIIRNVFLQISNLAETCTGVRIINEVSDVFKYEDEINDDWMS